MCVDGDIGVQYYISLSLRGTYAESTSPSIEIPPRISRTTVNEQHIELLITNHRHHHWTINGRCITNNSASNFLLLRDQKNVKHATRDIKKNWTKLWTHSTLKVRIWDLKSNKLTRSIDSCIIIVLGSCGRSIYAYFDTCRLNVFIRIWVHSFFSPMCLSTVEESKFNSFYRYSLKSPWLSWIYRG